MTSSASFEGRGHGRAAALASAVVALAIAAGLGVGEAPSGARESVPATARPEARPVSQQAASAATQRLSIVDTRGQTHAIDREVEVADPGAAAHSLEPPSAAAELSTFADATPAGRALNAYILADAESERGVEGAERYEAALEHVRELSREALPMLADAYRNLPASDFPTRERIVQILDDMSLHDAEPLLSEIALEPLSEPPRTGEQDKEGTQNLMDKVLRAAALEGLADLAARGNTAAKASLDRVMTGGAAGLRKEAAGLYVDSGADQRALQARAAQVLKPGDRWMVHRITMTSGDQVPMISRDVRLPASMAGRKLAPSAAPFEGAAGRGAPPSVGVSR